MDSKESSRSWFCVLNNPQKIYDGGPNEIAEKCLDDWVDGHPTRTGAVAYCISKSGLIHLHMVLEDSQKARFSAVKKVYPKANLSPTKGRKDEAEDYIFKRGKFKEAGEKVVYIAQYGEIKGNQGSRKDLQIVQELLEQGKTPNEIMDMSIEYRRYDRMIKDAYYRKRWKETTAKRDVTVYWHVGKPGTGKSHEMLNLIEIYGEDEVYLVTDFETGLDKFSGEKILFMDEFRGQMRYNQLLTILDVYKSQIKCRYTNIFALWTEVHITSVFPPEKVYQSMVLDNRHIDTVEQLKRRIDFIVYHQKAGDKYMKDIIPMSEYTNYEDMVRDYDPDNKWVREAESKAINEELPDYQETSLWEQEKIK